MNLKFFDKLSQNYIELLLNDKVYYNVIIKVKNEKNFTAHSNILTYRSSYFCKELENAPNENGIRTITKTNISNEIFDVILKYIYVGIVNLENTIDTKFIFDLMLAADELELYELSKKLETILIEDKAPWLKAYFSLVYHTIFDKQSFKNLENFCNSVVVKYPNLIFEAEDYTSLPESALVSLLKRDDLQMEEIKLWEYTLEWGIAQNPTLPSNIEEWTKEDFLALKTTLQRCLPYIRYFHISSKDILYQIQPYKKILDKQIWKDLMQHNLDPSQPIRFNLPARSIPVPELPVRIRKPFSTIISDEHVAEISSWIDRKTINYSSENCPYEFKSIFQASRDGFDVQTIWNMCHGYSNTVIIIKVADTDKILGGYNPLMWDKTTDGKWMRTNDSFIFSLKNGNIQNSILSRVKNPDYAVHCYRKGSQANFGLNFGDSLYIKKNAIGAYSCNNYYEKRIRATGDFEIINYEVFEVKKNT